MPKLTQDKINNLNTSYILKKWFVINNLQIKKIPGPHGFICKFCQTFKGKIIPMKIKRKENPSQFVSVASIATPKPDRRISTDR